MLLNQPQSKLGQLAQIVSVRLAGRPTTDMLKLSATLRTAYVTIGKKINKPEDRIIIHPMSMLGR